MLSVPLIASSTWKEGIQDEIAFQSVAIMVLDPWGG